MPEVIATALAVLVGALLAAAVLGRRDRARTEQHERVLAELRTQMADQFKVMSVDVLDANGKRFLELAKAQLAADQQVAVGELDKRTQAIDAMVKPVTTKLAEVDQRIAAFDKARAQSAGELRGQIEQLQRSGEQLRQGASALTQALRKPQGRGQWGELQLRRVVEMAGLSEQVRDFTTQHSVRSDEDALLRPDMVVNMPNGRCVVIDSKVSLEAYLDAVNAEDDAAAEPHLVRHAEQVRTHLLQLARKDYSTHTDGAMPDLVVLFLPAEHLFAAAVTQIPTLIEEAYGKGVMIASPTSLLTLMHAIARGWKEERLAENAEQIAALGRELHDRMTTLANHFAAVGKRLDSATEAYNRAVGTLETRVLVTTRRFEALDAAKQNAQVPEVAPAQGRTRTITAPELIDAADIEAVDEGVSAAAV